MTRTIAPLELPGTTHIHGWWLSYDRSQGRRPLLRLLSRYLDVSADSIELASGPQGRPYLAGPHAGRLDFNWSHSNQHAVIGIAEGIQLGIDIESHARRPRMLELARRYFAKAESMALQELDEPSLARAFWTLWTGKEAILKATGEGLSHGLDRVVFDLRDPLCPLVEVDGDACGGWQILRPSLSPDYSATVAWQGTARELLVRRLDD
ncbi:4'-phosphopantetheinyl transferase family protein [Frateuria aurantia]